MLVFVHANVRFVVSPQYDQYKTPMENIGLQDSLLTRFDLLFVMLDNIDKENDKTIADHVVRMHRYRLVSFLTLNFFQKEGLFEVNS